MKIHVDTFTQPNGILLLQNKPTASSGILLLVMHMTANRTITCLNNLTDYNIKTLSAHSYKYWSIVSKL